jgi:hypothetical protein
MKGSKAEDESQRDANKQLYDSYFFTAFCGLIMPYSLVDFEVANHDDAQRYCIACTRPKQVEVDLPFLQRVLVIT